MKKQIKMSISLGLVGLFPIEMAHSVGHIDWQHRLRAPWPTHEHVPEERRGELPPSLNIPAASGTNTTTVSFPHFADVYVSVERVAAEPRALPSPQVFGRGLVYEPDHTSSVHKANQHQHRYTEHFRLAAKRYDSGFRNTKHFLFLRPKRS